MWSFEPSFWTVHARKILKLSSVPFYLETCTLYRYKTKSDSRKWPLIHTGQTWDPRLKLTLLLLVVPYQCNCTQVWYNHTIQSQILIAVLDSQKKFVVFCVVEVQAFRYSSSGIRNINSVLSSSIFSLRVLSFKIVMSISTFNIVFLNFSAI